MELIHQKQQISRDSYSGIYEQPSESISVDETIVKNNKLYFEKKMNDRRKRTYDVLKQFDQELADIIISPSKMNKKKYAQELDQESPENNLKLT